MTQLMLEPETRSSVAEAHGFAASYLRFCSEHLAELNECIARHDLPSVSRIAHALRGNARLLGLSELSSLGQMLEEYCVGSDWGAISSAFEAISDTVERLCEGGAVVIGVEFEEDDTPASFAVRCGEIGVVAAQA
jgi:HPt (histidine-containing phosphotransfer) domain-containing protein